MRHRKWASATPFALVGLLVSCVTAPFNLEGDQVPQAIRAESALDAIAFFARESETGDRDRCWYVEYLDLASRESRTCAHLLDLAEEYSAAKESRWSDYRKSLWTIWFRPTRQRMAQEDLRIYSSGYAGEVIGRWLAEREAEGTSADELYRRLVYSATPSRFSTSREELDYSRFRVQTTEFEVRLTEALGHLPRTALESPERRADEADYSL